MSALYTASDVLAELDRVCGGRGGQRAFSRKHLIPESVVSNARTGKRELPQSIANALGLVETRAFRKIKGTDDGQSETR